MTEDHRYEIQVEPVSTYVADQSDPSREQFVFAYTIRITNTGTVAAKLVSRHWVITDGEHRVQEVRGPGVVGQTPVIPPGGTFSYTSGCPLKTPQGIMVGSYQMTTESGELFNVSIPAFSLDSPHARRSLN